MNTAGRPPVDVGEVIADRYRIDRVLGRGAMGLVVAATHVELRKPRAIKFMLPEAMHDRDSVERFLREARAAAELKSQHAVKIHDVARLPTGVPYIVMEYLEGIDFRSLMKERRVLPVPEAVSYVIQACEAIAEAHAAGIVHRDLKPANLFLAKGVGGAPCVKVLDFGIAKVNDTEAPPDEVHLTRTHVILGSPLYMSPEQIVSTKNVDGRTDLWSLGVLLYSLVTGELPFRGDSAQVVFASIQRDAPPPPSLWSRELPAEVERIILRCLEKDPARRYSTAAELAAALAPFAVERTNLAASASRDLSDTQNPTQVWRSSGAQSSPSGSGAYGSSSANLSLSSSNGGTQVLPLAPASAPGISQSYSAAPAAQTNSPMVQSLVTQVPAPAENRARALLFAGGGFVLALVLVALVVVLGRSGGDSTDTKPTAAAPQTANPEPAPVATMAPAPTPVPSAAPAAPPSTTSVPVRTAPPPSTAKAASAAATTPAPTSAPVKGPPVRRRDD
jgi:eukaryotic-like serine/threonine-protein kinase